MVLAECAGSSVPLEGFSYTSTLWELLPDQDTHWNNFFSGRQSYLPHKQGVIIFIVIVAMDGAETLLTSPYVPLARTPAYGFRASVSSAVK